MIDIAKVMAYSQIIKKSKMIDNTMRTNLTYKTALIVDAGPGISASLARRLSALGVAVARFVPSLRSD